MLRESFFVKILEGNYDNREPPQPKLKDPTVLLWEARFKGYRQSGMWLSNWGPKPGEPGCQMPPLVAQQLRVH